jgi:hypothetical protein
VSAEGREQPVIRPEVETTPKPVADAPDTTSNQDPSAKSDKEAGS